MAALNPVHQLLHALFDLIWISVSYFICTFMTSESQFSSTHLDAMGKKARASSQLIARATIATKNQCLLNLAALITKNQSEILAANQKDVATAQQEGLSNALLDRLKLSATSIAQMSEGLIQIATLADPIGGISDMNSRPSGIQVGRMRVPLGVIAIIYEARPNVTIDAAGLCIKSGNACILRGGREAIFCNHFLAQLIAQALDSVGLPDDAVQLIPSTDRELVTHLVQMTQYIDVIVPRGGKSLIARLIAEARVPMIKHLDGICHVYIDNDANSDMAVKIAFNAKCHRYGTCNTMETLLIGRTIAPTILPLIAQGMAHEKVELRADDAAYALLKGYAYLRHAQDEDWDTEYLAPILAIKVVDDLDAAIVFINQHGSKHTDSIVTENYGHAMRFLREVDSASVMVNASTRFADGFEYGLGAEIGISNDKLHARGPVGLEGLTSLKYVVLGNGTVRV